MASLPRLEKKKIMSVDEDELWRKDRIRRHCNIIRSEIETGRLFAM